jgi:hypothetical protein
MGTLKDAASVVRQRRSKLYCWEIIKCGREPGGHKAADLGICPVALTNPDRESGVKAFGRECFQ